jgi:hypothetical protein
MVCSWFSALVLYIFISADSVCDVMRNEVGAGLLKSGSKKSWALDSDLARARALLYSYYSLVSLGVHRVLIWVYLCVEMDKVFHASKALCSPADGEV